MTSDRPPGLTARVGLSLGRLDLDVQVAAEPGEVVALLGPNGAGKTTLLRTICGLQPLDRGRVSLGGVTLDDPLADVFVAPERRRLGVVFQHLALFDHMDATENVAFGPRAGGLRRGEARRRASSWLATLGLADVGHARPAELSGGQRQRVALARALATEPEALLLDEPLAALDVTTRQGVRVELRRHLVASGLPTLVVTHDPLDAHVLADRVVVVEAGRVVQEGTLAELGAHPRTNYVADLAGMNLLGGRLDGEMLTTPDGAEVCGTRSDPAVAGPSSGPGLASVEPRAIALYREPPHGSPRNCWAVTVVDIDRRGDRVRVSLAGPPELTAEITRGALDDLALAPGDTLWAVAKATEVRLYPA